MQLVQRQPSLANITGKSTSTKIERYKHQLHLRLCAIVIFIVQGALRLYALLMTKDKPHLAVIMYIVTFVLLLFIIILITMEYLLYKSLKYKTLKYSKTIDGIFFVFFLIEWVTTIAIPLADSSFRDGSTLQIHTLWTYTAFAWRILLQNFIIRRWYLKILTPFLANAILVGLGIYNEPDAATYMLLRGISQTAFIALTFYFDNKVSLGLMLTNLHQVQWLQVSEFILDNIPENLAIFGLDGEVKYLSAYLLEFMRKSNCVNDVEKFFENIHDLQGYENPDASPRHRNTQAEENSPVILSPKGLNLSDEILVRQNNLQAFLSDFKAIAKRSSIREKSFFIFNGKLSYDDQEEKSIEIKASFIRQQNLEYILLILRDTTQRDRLITLESNDKYKDQLLASVSHELRTPLNGSINLVESALMAKEIPETIKEQLLTPAFRSCKFLLHLINDILDMSQIKEHKLRLIYQEASLKESLNNAIQLVSLQAKRKGLKLEIDLDPSTPEKFCTDHSRLSQIVLNLVNNSIKFTQEGFVKVIVKLSQKHSNCLKITVDDSGMGMCKNDVSKLFQKFTHIEHQGRETINPTGAGLGLNIAYNLAELLGPPENQGIKVSSTPNLGSSFSFYLENRSTGLSIVSHNEKIAIDPRFLIPDEINNETDGTIDTKKLGLFIPRLSQFKSAPLLEPKCLCPKILVVDDDQFNIFAFEVILNSFNLKYDVAYTGKGALDKLLNKRRYSCGLNCKSCKLIFMDHEMPIMNGSETVKEIKKLQSQNLLKKDLAIIGCTAHNNSHEIDNFIACGLDDCLTKPISRDRVYEILLKYDALNV